MWAFYLSASSRIGLMVDIQYRILQQGFYNRIAYLDKVASLSNSKSCSGTLGYD